MMNQNLELVCVLSAISEVAGKLAEMKKNANSKEVPISKSNEGMNYDFDRMSKVADIMARCAKLGVSDNVMICSLKAKGLISQEEFEALSKF